MTDKEEQNDEVLVLESIYTTEELQITKEDVINGQFHAFVTVPPNFKIVYKMFEIGDKPPDELPTNNIHISHLPPITLSFTLPPNYPSQAMPDYSIACPWLNFLKMRKLCKKLEELWNENNNMVILYIWTQFLKEEAWAFLNIGDSLDLTGVYVMELKKQGRSPECLEKQGISSELKRTQQRRSSGRPDMKRKEKPQRKSRVSKGPNLNMHLHQYLTAYAEDRARTEFMKGLYLCEICFSDKFGSQCVQFKPCDHVYCRDCMKSYFEVRIKDGSIHSMPCPFIKCSSEAMQSQIREVVGPSLYARYDKRLLEATLDQMKDITYCPRSVCGCPVMRDNDDKMAVCPNCKHVFCVFCRMTYHGVQPCRLKAEEKSKLVKEYEEADENAKALLEKRYGKKQIELFMEEVMSETWISSNSKPCPTCNTSIEKSYGCNKMSCWKCNAYFCWLCLEVLDKGNPYLHYNDPKSRCKNMLFLGSVMGPDDGDDDDEDNFEMVLVMGEDGEGDDDFYYDDLEFDYDDDDDDPLYLF